ncbi:unannotated protein [freshwater metagenome]|uniref:Unannotated protein n=1 Tax=freshwater metagenome TaxID=449393 RepID=A0A6J7SAX9_9ZZZZ
MMWDGQMSPDSKQAPTMTPMPTNSGPSTRFDLTELVAGSWQLRPWPTAHADLEDLLAERFAAADASTRALEREARLEGWARGHLLGFAVREITTGASIAEVSVIVSEEDLASIDLWVRPGVTAAADITQAAEVVRRWAVGGLGLALA